MKDNDNKDQFLRFPDGLRWGSSATSYLFERPEYNNMLQLIENAWADENIAFVRGTPGIGKSLSGWWLLHNLIRDAVVKKKPVTILFGSLDEYPVLLSVDQKGNRSYQVVPTFYTNKIIDYFIVDSKHVGGTSTVGKYKIFISSNDNPHYDNAITNWGFKGSRIFGKLVMNPFSLDEIYAFASDVLPPNQRFPKQLLMCLFDVYGGSARYIWSAADYMTKYWSEFCCLTLTEEELVIYNILKEFFSFKESDLFITVVSTSSNDSVDPPKSKRFKPSSSSSSSSSKSRDSASVPATNMNHLDGATYGDVFKALASILHHWFDNIQRRKTTVVVGQSSSISTSAMIISMFHNVYQQEIICRETCWASPFMSYFAGYIQQHATSTVFTNIQQVLSDSGISGVHEYTAYRSIYNTFSKENGFFLDFSYW